MLAVNVTKFAISLAEICIMDRLLTSRVFLALLGVNCVFATNSTQDGHANSKGCTLLVPPAIQKQMEPQGAPLKINMTFTDIRIRDVPNEGCSFRVEFR